RAISAERASRTVIDDTTSPRLSFSLTLLRRMSLAPMGVLDGVAGGRQLYCPTIGFGLSTWIAAPREEDGNANEVRYQLQIGQRPGLPRGMAGTARACRLLSADR